MLCLQSQKIFQQPVDTAFSLKSISRSPKPGKFEEWLSVLTRVPFSSNPRPHSCLSPQLSKIPFSTENLTLWDFLYLNLPTPNLTVLIILSEARSLLLNSKYGKLICSQVFSGCQRNYPYLLVFQNRKGRKQSPPFLWSVGCQLGRKEEMEMQKQST